MSPPRENPPEVEALHGRIFEKRFPIDGVSLIEASAGTGKTYSIQSIYLRLILDYGLDVREILVVTFTDAATSELRERIRSILAKTQLFLEGGLNCEDGDYERISRLAELACADKHDRQRLRGFLQENLSIFDEAAIYTIHGFCNRVLSEWSFECGELFDQEICESGLPLLEELISDYYRARFLWTENDFEFALADFKKLDLDKLFRIGSQTALRTDAVILPEPGSFQSRNACALENDFNDLLKSWMSSGDDLSSELREAIDRGCFLKDAREKLTMALEVLGRADTDDIDYAPTMRALALFDRATFESGLTKRAGGAWKRTPKLEKFLDRVCRFLTDTSLWALDRLCRFSFRIRRDFALRKRYRRVLTYDDMLLRLSRSLSDASTYRALSDKLRSRYRAALVDEFQDTDRVQWDIIEKVFVEGDVPLFLVGDPKQAIYSFRSGDIYTYFHAVSKRNRHYGLTVNYRSDPALVDAVNSLFTRSPSGVPFVTASIGFIPQKASCQGSKPRFTRDGRSVEKPMRIRFLLAGEKGKWLYKTRAKRIVSADTAFLISKLLSDPAIRIDGRALQPSDICVLTTRHSQADYLCSVLSGMGIPVVRQRSGNVFCSKPAYKEKNLRPETREMLALLSALADPGDERSLRTTLSGRFFPHDAMDIYRIFVAGEDVEELESILRHFAAASALCRKRRFAAAFNLLDDVFSIREQLLSLVGGERLLTNVLHQVELIDDRMRELRHSLTTIAAWIEAMPMSMRDEDAGSHEMRLETDSKAVQVMTVFKAKGLEFPVVFLPFMWDTSVRTDENLLRYHSESERGERLVLDLDTEGLLNPADLDRRKARDMHESLAEQVRLLYVALTRASHLCFLYWGEIRSTEKCALNYLLHYGGKDGKALDEGFSPGTDLPDDRSARKPGLESLFPPSDMNVSLEPVEACEHDESNFRLQAKRRIGPAALDYRRFPDERSIEVAWHIRSFSSILNEGNEIFADGIDFDQDQVSPAEQDEAALNQTIKALREFPGGVDTGMAWHEILERVDFQAGYEGIKSLSESVLDKHALLPTAADNIKRAEKLDAVASMIEAVLTFSLAGAGDDGELILSRIPPGDRVAEMAFDFTVPERADMSTLNRILSGDWPAWRELGLRFKDDRSLLGAGFMTGFIDLCFRTRGDLYYIVDWKSNNLGLSDEDYRHENLKRQVVRHGYALQYFIYTTALHLHLGRCLPGYDYERNFGGVFYVFLRGVDGRPGGGVFFDRPPLRAVEGAVSVLGIR